MTASVIDEVLATAREWGRPDVAAGLERAQALSPHAVATVVVAGETGRGKSRFVNALVGVDVCPVDADVASNVFVALSAAPVPTATVITRDHPGGRRIAIDEVADWASVQSNPGNVRQVQRVDVGLPAPVLAAGVCLVDTPGVGGLDPSHRLVTLEVLRWADALIFVLDPDAPVSVPERDFLIEAAARVAVVLFVVTKSDRYIDAQLIGGIDRELIARSVPRLADAPVVCVSARDRQVARADGDADLDAASGFPTVERLLREQVAGRALGLRVVNLALAAEHALQELDLPLSLDATSAGPGAATEALLHARAELAGHAERTRGWNSTLFVEHQRRVAHPAQLELRRRLRALGERYEARLSAHQDLDDLPANIDAELQALALGMRHLVALGSAELIDHFVDQLGLRPSSLERDVAASGVLDLPALETSAALVGHTHGARRLTRLSSIARSALYGRSLAAAMGPLGLLVGVAVGGLGVVGGEWGQRSERAERAARGVLARALETARIEIDADLRSRLLDGQQAVAQEIQFLVEQRKAALTAEINVREAATRRDEAQREAQQTLARDRSAHIRTLRDRTHTLIDQARGLLGDHPGAPFHHRQDERSAHVEEGQLL